MLETNKQPRFYTKENPNWEQLSARVHEKAHKRPPDRYAISKSVNLLYQHMWGRSLEQQQKKKNGKDYPEFSAQVPLKHS